MHSSVSLLFKRRNYFLTLEPEQPVDSVDAVDLAIFPQNAPFISLDRGLLIEQPGFPI